MGIFQGWVIPVTYKVVLKWLPCLATDWPCVGILWLGEIESVICNFYLYMTAHTLVWTRSVLWDTLVRCWDVKQRNNQPTNKPYSLLLLPWHDVAPAGQRSVPLFRSNSGWHRSTQKGLYMPLLSLGPRKMSRRSGLTQIDPDLRGWNASYLLSLLFFPSGD